MQVQPTEMGGPAYRGRRSERTQPSDESDSTCESPNIIQVHVRMMAITSMRGRLDFGASSDRLFAGEVYCVRNATIGSTLVARNAGM